MKKTLIFLAGQSLFNECSSESIIALTKLAHYYDSQLHQIKLMYPDEDSLNDYIDDIRKRAEKILERSVSAEGN